MTHWTVTLRGGTLLATLAVCEPRGGEEMTIRGDTRSGRWGSIGMRGVVVSGSMVVTALALGAAAVYAAPSNAARAQTGTFDCGCGVTGKFLTNSTNSDATTWSPAFLTFDAGGTG